MPTIATLVVDVETRTRRFTAGLKTITGGLAVLAAGAAYAFKQFEDSEKVTADTAAALESTGHAAHITSKQIQDLATAIGEKTAVDDEAIQSGENLLLTFTNIRNEVGKGNDIFNQATQAVVDMSARFDQDLKSSAIQLGKALNDPVAGLSALTRIGVQFTEEEKHAIEQAIKHNNILGAQKVILSEVATQTAGSAEAQATATAKMGFAFGQLAEQVGKILAPAFQFLADWLNKIIGFLQDNLPTAIEAVSDWFKKMWERIQPVAEVIASVLWPALQAAWGAIQDHLIPALGRLWEAFGPILKILGLVALAFGVVIVGQVLILIDVLGHIIDAFSKVIDWVREHVAEPIVGAIEKVISAIGDVIGWIKDRFVGAWQAALGPITAVIGKIIDWIETLIGWIQKAVEWLGKLGSATPAPTTASGAPAIAPHVNPPQAAHGGFVVSSGLAVIHKGEHIAPAGAGGNTVIVNGWVGSDTALARKIRDELNKLSDRNAGSGIR